MTNGDSHYNPHMEQIDADAVCAECGTVSPEGTLLCRQCGNNLRDQRAQRISAVGQTTERSASFSSHSKLLRGGLMAFGLLVVLWVGLNAGNIEEMLLGLQVDEEKGADEFWSGSKGGTFDALLDELTANPVTEAEVDALLGGTSGGGELEGRYALLSEGGVMGPRKVGEAIVRRDGDSVRFVVLMPRWNVELRGVGRLDGDSRITAAEGSVGALVRGDFYGAAGFAQVVEEGTLECHGLTAFGEDTYSAMAFRVP